MLRKVTDDRLLTVFLPFLEKPISDSTGRYNQQNKKPVHYLLKNLHFVSPMQICVDPGTTFPSTLLMLRAMQNAIIHPAIRSVTKRQKTYKLFSFISFFCNRLPKMEDSNAGQRKRMRVGRKRI